MHKMSVRSLLAAGTIAGTAFGAVGSASAATAQQATQDSIRAQQAQIDYLKQQLELVSDKLQQLQTQAATAAKTAEAKPAAPRVTESATNKFALESADGRYSVGVTGILQGDVGYYPGFSPKSTIGPQNLNAGFNARRARIGVTGKAAGDFTYTFIYDGGNSSDATAKGIEAAQVSYVGIKNVSLDFGYANQLFTLDQSTSSADTLFMERATPSNIATGLNTGDNRSSVGGRYYNDRLWAGAYITGPAVGDVHGQAERIGAFERVAYQVLQDPVYTLHLGVGIDELLKAPLNNGAAAATTSVADPVTGVVTTSNVTSPYSISLSDQPELRVDTTTFASTGTLGSLANPVTSGQVYDLELAGNYQNFFFQGEYYHYQINRRDLDPAKFDGGYGEAAWTLTGETRKYLPASGAYTRIIPAHAFAPDEGYWGAWEVAGRVSYIDLTSGFTPGLSLKSQPSAVNGGKQTSFTAGLNWYPNNYMRFELNYIHTNYDKDNSGSTGILGAPIGANIDALGFRTQVTW